MSATEIPAGTQASTATTPARSWPVLALAVAVGLAAGALTLAGQKLLAGSGWFILVNSASPWLMVAFAVGTRAPGRWWTAAVAGALTQAGVVVGYYATARLSALPVAWSSVLIWVATGVVAGPMYGAAGAAWRDRRILLRVAALGLLGGVWVQDGIHALRLATDVASPSGPGVVAGWSAIAVGALLPLIAGRSTRDRLLGLLATVPVAAAVFVAYQVVGWSFAHR